MTGDIPYAPKGAVHRKTETLPGLYMQAAARFAQRLDSEACGQNMVKPPFIGVLHMVGQHPGIRQGLCAEALGFDATTFGRYIDRMVRDGLLEREVPERDRRAVSLRLTEIGRAAVAEARPVVRELETDVRRRMGDANWDKLTELLEQFLDVYDHPLPQVLREERSGP